VANTNIGVSLYAHLPSIYADVNVTDNPIAALLALWYDLYSELEDLRGSVDELFDPHKVPDNPGHDFLSWLARWVAINPDEEIFAVRRGRRRLRSSIAVATSLYARRGTIGGLCELVEAFLEERISIIEWSWPIGLKIGQNSTIGVDTFLTDRPELGSCFTVKWHRQFHITDDAVASLSMPLAGARRNEVVSIAIAAGLDAAAGIPWFPRVRRLHRLLMSERPAHTACFLALDLPRPTEPKVPAGNVMIIGVTSTIGMCSIEQAV
jgi:phage tail-like protein